ncbi:MAG: hypothetical protein AB7H97_09075 [Pseudobdellovibrionaceae bacterium]
MFRIILALSVLMSASAHAAVSPYWNQVNKLQIVIGSSELAEQAASVADSIKSVSEVKPNVFAVQFDKYSCVMMVTLKVVPPRGGMIGPAQYEIASVVPNGCERP